MNRISPGMPWLGVQHGYLSGSAFSMRLIMNYILTISVAATLALAASTTTASPGHPGAPAVSHPTIATAPTARAPSINASVPNPTRMAQGRLQTGQPNASCGSLSAPSTPGNAAGAPGSAFNPDGKAGTVYAGEQPQNSRNPRSVSQYDAACLHQPLH